ncbi:uncharacterized protein PAC_14980 [Phialocephala subalpina]|uniref:Apple domain-containing protein n=1 Tax=Phialocephala subalpina TaxID=576137 RepID=A0A1L7XJ59_9HELO|nr:uncharacterized protein PAC_14980 [Phialocephala subalpina]
MKLNICLAATLVAFSHVVADDFRQVPIIPTITVTVTSHYTPPTSITSYASSSPTRSPSKTSKIHKTSDYSLGPKATPVAVGYPLCGIPGYTNAMGDYKETTHKQPGANLQDCLKDCQNSGGICQSIAFHKRYTMCLWFDKEVQGTWLGIDKKSK